jgi:hypothetical protein
LGGISYAQGLQLQTVNLARDGVKFEQPSMGGASFGDVAGFY